MCSSSGTLWVLSASLSASWRHLGRGVLPPPGLADEHERLDGEIRQHPVAEHHGSSTRQGPPPGRIQPQVPRASLGFAPSRSKPRATTCPPGHQIGAQNNITPRRMSGTEFRSSLLRRNSCARPPLSSWRRYLPLSSGCFGRVRVCPCLSNSSMRLSRFSIRVRRSSESDPMKKAASEPPSVANSPIPMSKSPTPTILPASVTGEISPYHPAARRCVVGPGWGAACPRTGRSWGTSGDERTPLKRS